LGHFDNKSSIEIFLVSVTIIAFSLVFFIPIPSSAYEVTYEPLGFEFDHSPTICAIEPQDQNLSSREIEKLLEQARISISEWDGKLKSAEKNRNKKDNWSLNYVVIEAGKNYDSSDCDIAILFKEKYEKPIREHGILGTAKPDPINDTWEVSLYYLQLQQCYQEKKIGAKRYYWYDPCFSDDLKTSEQIGSIIRHELGHAFGLGHYEADDYRVNQEWGKGEQPAKSIMTVIEPEFVKESKIRDVDVLKLREIYDENGFLPDSDTGSFTIFKPENMNYQEFYAESLAYIESFYSSDPDDEDILYQKGLALFGLDRFDEAKSTMDKVIDLNPEHDGAWFTTAKAQSELKEYDKALETLDKILEIEPEHDGAISYKGQIFSEQEKFDEALEYFEEAFDLNSFNKENLNRYGFVLYQKGDFEDSLWYFDRALYVEPDYIEAINNKALVLDELGRSDEAQTLYDRVKELEATKSSQEKPAIVKTPPQEIPPIVETSPQEEPNIVETTKPQIPDWIRNNAKWWAGGAIGDNDFVSGIQYLIKEDIMQIPETTSTTIASLSNEIPSWIKNNADWWSQGLISDDDFVKGIQYLVEQGIIKV